ncbi:MAG: CerR family C-terminal domain-containing protein [Hyphomicrobiales bacterium]
MGVKPSETSRDRLLAVAIDLFGRRGLDGVSTREIAKEADVNIAAIAYHFGGKQQLYLACAEHIAGQLKAGIALLAPAESPSPDPGQALKDVLHRLAKFMLATPEIAPFARFILREHMDPSPALDILYSNVMEPMHRSLCELWAAATGKPAASEQTKLRVFALLSQVLVFRMARAGALRRMGWDDLGPREFALIMDNADHNIDALLAQENREKRR